MEDGSSVASIQERTEPVRYAQTTWRALAALKTEHQHALRHALDRSQAVESTGEVHQQHETPGGLADSPRSLKTSDQSYLREVTQPPACSQIADDHAFPNAVRMETERTSAKVRHQNPEKDVVVRVEFIRGTASRVIAMAMVTGILIGATVLLAEFIKKLQLGWSPYYFNHTAIYAWDTAVATLCLVILTPSVVSLVWGLCWVSKQKKLWLTRVRVSATVLALEAIVQWINLVFYLAPNVYVLSDPCNILAPFVNTSGFVQWSCWNTIFMLFLALAYGCQQRHRAHPLAPIDLSDATTFGQVVVDGGLHKLWPCLIPWLAFEATMGYAWLHHLSGSRAEAMLACQAGEQTMSCPIDKGTRIGIILAGGLAGVYFVLTCALLMRKLNLLKQMPYSAAKRGIVYFTLQLWLRLGVMAYFLLCMGLLWLVRTGSCAASQFVDTGVMPMHIVMTVNSVVLCYLCSPIKPSKDAAACKVWLQEVAWTEADKPVKLAARSNMLPKHHRMEQQPVFCYETMLKLLYWSCLVYDHNRGRRNTKSPPAESTTESKPMKPTAEGARTILTLETAMGLYGLTESESLWEVQQDTRCLVSWGHRHVVVAFRGTASIKNALADLQAWRVPHPPARGKRCMGTRPLVHVGFLKSWLAGGLNEKVTSAVLKAVEQCRTKLAPSDQITVYVTGHSLGGAMATLAAHDIRTGLQALAMSNIKVVCYTFAAPRTGNHAFARDYNATVPDTWSVINDQDVVTREGKLLFLYKRPGQRVIVDAKGRLIVRPSHLEASVQRDTAGQSVKHHMLSSYFHAVLSVALAQFSPSGFPCGMPGIIRLAEASPYVQDVLESQMGMRLTDMRQYSQLTLAERGGVALPGSHPPVKGFYLIKPSPAVASSKCLVRNPSMLHRLRHPRRSGSTHSLVPSSSLSEIGSVSDIQEVNVALDSSPHSPKAADIIHEDIHQDSEDVVINIDDAQTH